MMFMDDPLLDITHYAIRVEAGGSGSWNFPDEDEFSTSSSSSSDDDEDEEQRAETKANSGQRRAAGGARRWDRRCGYTRAIPLERESTRETRTGSHSATERVALCRSAAGSRPVVPPSASSVRFPLRDVRSAPSGSFMTAIRSDTNRVIRQIPGYDPV